jgi:uncharacterized protein (DUF1778 family)
MRRSEMANKTTTVTFRMNPSVKEMLRVAADKERRSVANMIEVMVVEYAKNMGIEENGIKLKRKSALKSK